MTRVYLDNNLLAYLVAYEEHRASPGFVAAEGAAVSNLVARGDIEVLCSDESLTEIGKLTPGSRRAKLEARFHALKAGKPVIRNAAVSWDDGMPFWDSPDVTWDHKHDDADLARVKAVLASAGVSESFDARYLANALLAENRIDAFLTADKNTIWNHRAVIRSQLGVRVALPSELAAELGV